jgi:hypothetical protein
MQPSRNQEELGRGVEDEARARRRHSRVKKGLGLLTHLINRHLHLHIWVLSDVQRLLGILDRSPRVIHITF